MTGIIKLLLVAAVVAPRLALAANPFAVELPGVDVPPSEPGVRLGPVAAAFWTNDGAEAVLLARVELDVGDRLALRVGSGVTHAFDSAIGGFALTTGLALELPIDGISLAVDAWFINVNEPYAGADHPYTHILATAAARYNTSLDGEATVGIELGLALGVRAVRRAAAFGSQVRYDNYIEFIAGPQLALTLSF